jgi:hypothetical protein
MILDTDASNKFPFHYADKKAFTDVLIEHFMIGSIDSLVLSYVYKGII